MDEKTTMQRELIIEAPGRIGYRPVDLPPEPAPTMIRARSVLSGISHGTEMTFFRGTTPFNGKVLDTEKRICVPRPKGSNFYPLPCGYDNVAIVEAVGDSVDGFAPGQVIWSGARHCERFDIPAAQVRPLTEGMTPEAAVLWNLGGVAMTAVHDARPVLGDRVAVFGLGAIGLIAIQLFQLSGAEGVYAVDPIRLRRETALKLGATAVIDPSAEDVGQAIHRVAGGQVERAVEVSGSYDALAGALRVTRPGGEVIAAGYYTGDPGALRLGEEFHHNRLTIKACMSVWGNAYREAPLWSRERAMEYFGQLVLSGRVKLSGLVTHRIPFERAQEAFELVRDHSEDCITVCLDYREP
jgi:2-desacetyl-2-hydroxyethyl bacteriochlorophyllide A dehydrogenase